MNSSEKLSGSMHWLHSEPVGPPRVVTDAATVIVQQHRYRRQRLLRHAYTWNTRRILCKFMEPRQKRSRDSMGMGICM